MRIATLKRRAEFIRIRGGARWSTGTLVLEAKPRTDTANEEMGSVERPRFGFTVTKKIGSAVVRNRVRRRLRAAVVALPPGLARPEYDYVLIARQGAIAGPFALLQRDLADALSRVHRGRSPGRGPSAPPPAPGSRRKPKSAPVHGKTS